MNPSIKFTVQREGVWPIRNGRTHVEKGVLKLIDDSRKLESLKPSLNFESLCVHHNQVGNSLLDRLP